MAGSIGIKQANGNFYAILDENSDVKKRMVLTTVHDNQKSVQIDLYRNETDSMADAAYIGSIVVENITLKPKGEPSIEMTLISTHEGSVSVYAVDLANPENKHHLNVSLASLEEDQNEYPDFEANETQESQSIDSTRERKKIPALAIIITGLLLVFLCLVLWFFLFRDKPSGDAERSQTAVIGRARAQTSIVVKAGARERLSAPVDSLSAPQTIPPEGITSTIK